MEACRYCERSHALDRGGAGTETVAACPICLMPWHEVCAQAVAGVAVLVDRTRPAWELAVDDFPEEFASQRVCGMCRMYVHKVGLEGGDEEAD